jgi:hypothetical protein
MIAKQRDKLACDNTRYVIPIVVIFILLTINVFKSEITGYAVQDDIITESDNISQQQMQVPDACQTLQWPFWVLYIAVVVFTLYIISLKNRHKKHKLLLQILIASNALLAVIILLDLACLFRWHIAALALLEFLLIYLMYKMLIKKSGRHKK